MSDFKDRFESIVFRLKPPRKSRKKYDMGVRPLPRFLSIESYKEGESFSIIVPTARRTWWIVCLIGLAVMWVSLVPFFFAASFIDPQVTNRGYVAGYFNPIIFIIGIGLLLGVTWLIWMFAFPRIRVTADHEKITVHNRVYDWQTANGFRLGYSIGGVEREDTQGAYSGLRMAYGRWGDDLPFLVRGYYAPAYIMFLNETLQAIEPRSPADETAETGIKPVLF